MRERGACAGFDIGGAHIKAALARNGRVIQVVQIPCPLWRGLHELDTALAAEPLRGIVAAASRHAVTMTGELADVFPDRFTGVARIVERTAASIGAATRYWMGRRGLGSAAEAEAAYTDVASTNFLASAELAAAHLASGLLVDIGSTTTDIVPFRTGRVIACGLTDGDRLRTGELVYTGLTRTPVMAVTTRAAFQGIPQGLARDAFATMADVRRVLASLPDDVDQYPTQDGRGKTLAESRARLARCFGRDYAPGEDDDWSTAAAGIADVQLRSILDSVAEVLTAVDLPADAPVIAAGIGADVAADVAKRLCRPAFSFGDLIDAAPDARLWATRCAPASALALLA